MEADTQNVRRRLHAGILRFSDFVRLSQISEIAERLARNDKLKYAWIRRITPRSWGIEFLLECNGTCEQRDIFKESRGFLSSLGLNRKSHMLDGIDLSGEVIMVKPSPELEGSADPEN